MQARVCHAQPASTSGRHASASCQHQLRPLTCRRRRFGRQPAALLDDASVILQGISQSATLPHPGLLTGVALNTVVFTTGYKILRKGLTPLGVANAWLLGATIFSAFGMGGYLLVCLYFIFGTLATKIKLEQKQKEGIAGVACAAAALATGQYALWQVGFVASFASKLSDTVSSEIGKAYGKTTYLVTTFARVPRGTEGAVSLEGTAAGVGAALVFAAVALAVRQVSAPGAVVVTTAAILANFFESYLGAVVQGRVEWLSNDLVNMIQISLAALLAVAANQYLGLPPPVLT